MKISKNIKNYLSNPFVLAIIPAIIVILLVPDIFSKYSVRLIEKRYESATGSSDYYVDLNNNGKKEHVETNEDSSNDSLLSFLVSYSDERFMEQFNFSNNTLKIDETLFFGDCNNNDTLEVFGFTIRRDSLFLNYLEPFNKSHEKHKVFISRIGYDKFGEINAGVSECYSIDLNNDGNMEIVFPIRIGYGLFPRAVYTYDIHQKSVNSTQSIGSPSYNLKFSDLTGDGKLEVICDASVPNNFINESFEVSYSDDRPWLKVYKSDMTELFKPISFPKGENSGIKCFVDTSNNKPEIDVLYYTANGIGNKSFLASYDKDGREIKKIEIDLIATRSSTYFLDNGNDYLVFDGIHRLLKITKDFVLIEEINLKEGGINPVLIDLDDNGLKETLMINEDKKGITIYSDNFKKVNILSFGEKTAFYKDYVKIEKNKFYLVSENYTYFYSYKLNYLYYIKYLIYLVIYYFFGIIFLGLKKIQESQMRDKQQLKSQVRELQLRTVKNQLNPHFTFNALNVLSGLSREGDNEGVDNFISKFSKMLRSQLGSSDNTNVSIEKELEFIENYIELQKIRFEKRIDFEIKIDPRIKENAEIPKMLIHTHVENAIKHGLMPKTDGGKIQVDISSFNRGIKVTILDNGIGRVKAKEKRTFGTGTGLKVLDEIFDLHYQINKVRIKQTITDLYNVEKQPAGTKVEIIIPRI